MNFVNSIKQSVLVWINGTSLDLRYILMRSPSPTKYAYGDEHYRIKFKDSTVESPCSLDNIIVHKGFSLNFALFMMKTWTVDGVVLSKNRNKAKNKTNQTNNQCKTDNHKTTEMGKDHNQRTPKRFQKMNTKS